MKDDHFWKFLVLLNFGIICLMLGMIIARLDLIVKAVQ